MFKDDATEVGVSGEVEEVDEFAPEEEERYISPREIAMKEVAANRRKALIEEEGFDLDGEEEEEEEEEEESPKKIIAKIDGVEEELTEKELNDKLREYQKHKAADKRLEEAAQKLKEAAEQTATLKKQTEENLKLKTIEDDKLSTLEGYDEIFDKFAREIRDGDDEDAVEATKEFAKALTGLLPKSGSPTDISQAVKEAVETMKAEEQGKREKEEEEKLEKETKEARLAFDKTFKEELENPDFFDLALMEDNKLLKDVEWTDKPLSERFQRAGENAKQWLKGKGSANSLKNKKKALKNVKSKSSVMRLKDKSEEDSPLSASQIINQMRKQRNQPEI